MATGSGGPFAGGKKPRSRLNVPAAHITLSESRFSLQPERIY